MKYTTNYSLKKPDGTDVVNIDDFNTNADIIDTELTKRALKTDIPTVPVQSVNSKTGAVVISKSDVGLGNVNNWGATTAVNSTSTTTYATASAVKQAYDKAVEAFQSASDGKTKIAAAITGKGISTSASATFDTMAANINSLASVSIDGIPATGNLRLGSGSTLWINNELAYEHYNGSSIVYNNNIVLLGGSGSSNSSYISKDGISWSDFSRIPYSFVNGSSVVYNNEIHLLGSTISSYSKYHYKWNGNSWTSVSTLPYNFRSGAAVIYNNEIYIIGGFTDPYTQHYKWNGNSWTSVSTLPFRFWDSNAVVYNNEIHILGDPYNNTQHYKWNGNSWTSVSTLPYNLKEGNVVVYNNEIHMLGSYVTTNKEYYNHYKWNGSSWEIDKYMPYYFTRGSALVHNNEIYIFGGEYIGNSTGYKRVYSFNGNRWCIHLDNYDRSGDAVVYKDEIYHINGISFRRYNHELTNVPFNSNNGVKVVYNNEIHIFGNTYSSTSHYKWNGSSWSSVSTSPYYLTTHNGVVYNNEIHIIKDKYHYKWNGSSWSLVSSSLPINCFGIVLHNNEIHIFGSTHHYKWNGSSWSLVSIMTYNVTNASIVNFNNEIHLLGGSDKNMGHYKWSGTDWCTDTQLPLSLTGGSAVVYNNMIRTYGSDYSNAGYYVYILK